MVAHDRLSSHAEATGLPDGAAGLCAPLPTNIVHLVTENRGGRHFALQAALERPRHQSLPDNDAEERERVGGNHLKTPESPERVTPHSAKAKLHSEEHGPPAPERMSVFARFGLLFVGLMLLGIGLSAPPNFLTHFTVFVLACFIGYQVIWSVTPALHTPLSVTNGMIIMVGGMMQIGGNSAASILGVVAILLASINIVGGFLVHTAPSKRMFHR